MKETNNNKTIQALAAITDEGLFELLATSILREANPSYLSLVHPGVNVEGKTVKSPLDGICFIQGADPPHMVAVHHTTAKRDNLEKKWLHDPSKVKPRKGSRPTAPPGDLIKTSGVVAEERIRTPNLRATLVLTTNEEPSENLIRTVEAEGRDCGLEIDLWSRSRLSHFLDNHPTGQWIRHAFLNIEQELLSTELLYELSKKNLGIYHPLDNSTAWVTRELDTTLKTSLRSDVTFLMAKSGLGKSVACYRKLVAQVEDGGIGFVLPHEMISQSATLEQAIMMTLSHLHPSLTEVGPSVFSFFSPERPLFLVVEDINRSGQTKLLIEKLVSWSRILVKEDKTDSVCWRLICPLWPEFLSTLEEQFRKRIAPLIISTGGFTASEGREAVLARAQLDDSNLSPLSAQAISDALGHDPLLIALYDQNAEPDPHKIINQFVEGSLSRSASDAKKNPTADYRQALRKLAGEMLAKHQLELHWSEIKTWEELQGEHIHLISQLAHRGELIRYTGPSSDQRISFRHDRVRNWLLTDAVAELDCQDLLTLDIMGEPYFAEIMGEAIVWTCPKSNFLQRIATLNPLALFHALRVIGQADNSQLEAILKEINDWLDNLTTHDRSNLHLRREALAMLAGTDSLMVPALVQKFQDSGIDGELARLRNGDIVGGIELCTHIVPGSGAPWRDIQVEHAKLHHGQKLIKSLGEFLKRMDLESNDKVGALRMAGHIADPSLALSIEMCWTIDDNRHDHLGDYLWALAECCADDPARFLEPVCNAWAELSDQPEKEGWPSQRDELASHDLRWAFHRWPPVAAIDYFVQRGSRDDLKWPITYMLHGVDHPRAIAFVVQELAITRRRIDETGSFWPFLSSAKEEWTRAQEYGHPMSKPSRDLLLKLFQNKKNDKYLRAQAFSFWAATQKSDDLDVLLLADSSDELANDILRERLVRGDKSAIPVLIEKLVKDDHGYWWQFCRHIWSQELTVALEEILEKRATRSKKIWGNDLNVDWIVSEMIMKLPENEAEHLLLKHWEHLRFSPCFVQTALYVATPHLLEAAQDSINECPEPDKIMAHLSMHFGIRTKGRLGITRESQLVALAPYLHLLSSLDLRELWETCNKRGWFTLRRELLDSLLEPPFKWNYDQVVVELDEMITNKDFYWVDDWIDRYLKANISWNEILTSMAAWFDERQSLEALKLVASAIMHQGTRNDVNVLTIYEQMPTRESKDVISNTQFTVYRRNIR